MEIEVLVRPTRDRGARWSVRVSDVDGGDVLASYEPDALLPTASVGKVFLLIEVAARVERGELELAHLVDRDAVPPVADSGLWQHLATGRLPLADVVRLVGTVSDNWATNALLDVVGLEAVQDCAAVWAPGGSMLHDQVRDVRRAGDPATLSEGSASDWTQVFGALARGEVVSPFASEQVLDWLATGVDLSMVGSAFGLDPLAHGEPDRGVRLWSKTGSSSGVRADVGLVDDDGSRLAYAVLSTWPAEGPDLRDDVLATMRRIGAEMRNL